MALAKQETLVSIRFLDMSEMDEQIQYKVGAYYSIETNYRLFLFSSLFECYDRMLYLDSDIVVTGDISELYDRDLNGKPLGAVEEIGMRLLSKTKQAVFFDHKPYNVDNYRTDGLHMKHMDTYFNAGVLLLDLRKTRELFDTGKALEVLHSHAFFYNDQDVLNILYDGQVELLDCRWNYMINIERQVRSKNPNNRRLFEEFIRTDYRMIHYVSAEKPWNYELPLGQVYWEYRMKLEKKLDKELKKEFESFRKEADGLK